ncbi:MAG TPA: aquaporin [Thermoplasmata archaeon]|nr:aquaporin [Thermoplasmata archaeon]
MRWSAGQRYLAEFLGTFGLLVAITGAALLSLNMDLASAAATTVFNARVLLLSLSLGFGVLGMIYAFGDISGAHFNPAVTVAMLLTGRTKATDAVGYILAQVAGGIVGVLAVAGVAYGSSTLWGTVTGPGAALAAQGYSGNGAPYGVSMGAVFLLEVVMTFFLVTVILFGTRKEGSASNLAPVGIALTLAMTNFIAIPIDGASVNPARSFAPALLSAWFSGDRWAIQQDWIFWVAPIVGAAIAALVELALRPKA